MIKTATRTLAATRHRVPVQGLLRVGTIGGFGALLAQDQVSPLLVYCLQVFLAA